MICQNALNNFKQNYFTHYLNRISLMIKVGFLFGGNVYGELKFIELLSDVFESYILGKYYAAVAVASMAAERPSKQEISTFMDFFANTRFLK